MGYADAERWRNTGAGALGLGATGAGIGTAIAPGIGTAIGGGIGVIIGGISGYFLTDDEKNEVIERYRQGTLDDATLSQIEQTIARRYDILQGQQSADLARRGLDPSSFAARQITETANAERQSLAEAIAGESGRRQAIGFGMSDAAAQQRASDVAGGVGALFEGYQLAQLDKAMVRDAEASDRLAAAIGQVYEGGPATRGVAPVKSPMSQTGAGNAFARHRSRAPNVTLKWDALKTSRNTPTWLQ